MREAVAEGTVNIEYVPTENMNADILTKGLTGSKFICKETGTRRELHSGYRGVTLLSCGGRKNNSPIAGTVEYHWNAFLGLQMV